MPPSQKLGHQIEEGINFWSVKGALKRAGVLIRIITKENIWKKFFTKII